MAKILSKIYKATFYGKEMSRYRIEKDQLADLSGRKINTEFVDEIKKELSLIGYVFVDITGQYAVLEKDPMHRYRKVNKKIVEFI